MLTLMGYWQRYAAEPPTDFDHAKDKLQALSRVMGAMIGDIIEKWDWHMIHGSPVEAWENGVPAIAGCPARRAAPTRPAPAISNTGRPVAPR